MTRSFFAGSIDSRARRPGRVERWCLALAVAMGLGFTPIASAQTFDLTAATIKNLNLAFDDGTLTSERLVDLYLARIAAYDKVGPKLNAVLALNINAVETARALDVERKVNGPRSLLHGTPRGLEGQHRYHGPPDHGRLHFVKRVDTSRRRLHQG